jgi:hypothetical protein
MSPLAGRPLRSFPGKFVSAGVDLAVEYFVFNPNASIILFVNPIFVKIILCCPTECQLLSNLWPCLPCVVQHLLFSLSDKRVDHIFVLSIDEDIVKINNRNQ